MLVEVPHEVAYSFWNKKKLSYTLFFFQTDKEKKSLRSLECILSSPRDVLTKIHLSSTFMYG